MDALSSAAGTLPHTSPVDSLTSGTTEDDVQGGITARSSWRSVVLGVVQYLVVCVTVTGNVLVLIPVARTKRLQTTFNMYVVTLALTDVLVALTAMTFYSTEQTLGYWPFGEFMCGVWIFFDYGTTFASVFTLIVISVDRLWSVMWSVHYRSHRTKGKAAMSIVVIWVAVLFLWLPACVVDRVKYSTPEKCIWNPAQNREFVVVIAVVGHHGSCVTILTCYLIVFLALRSRVRRTVPAGSDVRSNHTTSRVKSAFRTTEETTEISAEKILPNTFNVPFTSKTLHSSGSGRGSLIRCAPTDEVITEGSYLGRSSLSEKLDSGYCLGLRTATDSLIPPSGSSLTPEVSKTHGGDSFLPCETGVGVAGSENQNPKHQVTTALPPPGSSLPRHGEAPVQGEGLCQEHASSSAVHGQTLTTNFAQRPPGDVGNRRPDFSGIAPFRRQNSSANRTSETYPTRSAGREKRAFVTLTYIVVGFMVCWVPFHLVFDVTAARPDLVPDAVYSLTFWMTYVNSAINPILYNFSNSEFRRAFKEMLGRK